MGRGLIPAHAGKTPPTVQGRSCARAHPRSCGENERTPRHEVPRRGSPPLTRGKPVSGASPHAAAGLIPTHAGKTERRDRCLHPPRAHPRSRGENATLGPNRCPVSGSSPLTRGKHVGHADSLAGGGLIPAHAGKTPIHTRVYAYRRAHPRSRGENRPPVRSRASWAGSSPLTRGKLPRWSQPATRRGLIPAHAGKTLACVWVGEVCRAHPRSRGENLIAGLIDLVNCGSSPLTRGKRADHGHGPGRGGLIPAHAGKTAVRATSQGRAGAHPRSRGENPASSRYRKTVRGSSPLTRGKRGDDISLDPPLGLIPAHAGKTRA